MEMYATVNQMHGIVKLVAILKRIRKHTFDLQEHIQSSFTVLLSMLSVNGNI